MEDQIDREEWSRAQDYPIPLDKDGRVIDYLDPETHRPNTAEERIRQRMVQVLVAEFGYPKTRVAVERSIHIGRDVKRADIVVFASAAAKQRNDQGQIVLIGETKSPSVENPDGQLISYLTATAAQGGFWTNGEKMQFYRLHPVTKRIEEWIGIPREGQSWDSVGQFGKSDLIVPIDLKSVFRRCHNALYSSGMDSEDTAMDMVRVILAKVEDESTGSDYCLFHITQEEFDTRDGRKRACQRVRQLFKEVKDRYPDVFSAHEEITASDQQLGIVISYLQPYSFLDAPYDVIGTAYEVYVASHLKGERGQYFTNRLVVNMMVEMVDPDDRDTILDPACGSGGFLITAMNHVRDKIGASGRPESAKAVLRRNVCNNLYGVDTTPKLVKVAKTNMLLSRDGHTGIIRGNSLAEFEDLPEEFRKRAGKSIPTIVLTNPPFGSGYEQRIRDESILGNFQNGRAWTCKDGKIRFSEEINRGLGVPPEILFLERCIQWVRPGGQVAIVMAKGQLDNKEALAARHYVLDKCKVLAVVNLHEDTFEPFVGSRASVLVLQKKRPSDSDDYRIFMAISRKVGQTSRGEPVFKRDSMGNILVQDNGLVLDEDLSEIADAYWLFRNGNLEESAYRFSISRDDIDPDSVSLNPVQYLPAHNAALEHVLTLGETDQFEVRRLADLGPVFNGPRFKRPYAEPGVTEGPTIRKYFTGTALTQLHADNIKYLDSRKADDRTKQHLEDLTIYKGYLLISDSGTLGRVTYALSIHDGHVATNNLIRVVIDDEHLRGYVYQFLRGSVGQHLLLRNAYGTNQEHLEPDAVGDIPIPIPTDPSRVRRIGERVLASVERLEESLSLSEQTEDQVADLVAFDPA